MQALNKDHRVLRAISHTICKHVSYSFAFWWTNWLIFLRLLYSPSFFLKDCCKVMILLQRFSYKKRHRHFQFFFSYQPGSTYKLMCFALNLISKKNVLEITGNWVKMFSSHLQDVSFKYALCLVAEWQNYICIVSNVTWGFYSKVSSYYCKPEYALMHPFYSKKVKNSVWQDYRKL